MSPERISRAKPSSLGIGVYTMREASRLIGVRPDRIARWVRGYKFKGRGGKPGQSQPLFRADRSGEGDLVELTFLDLIELLFVRAFLKEGVSMPVIRKAAFEGAQLFHVNHPFCVKRFETDGREIFATVGNELKDDHVLGLTSKQAVFKEIVSPLFRQLQFDVVGVVSCWWPRGRGFPVLLDPNRAFGSPIVSDRGVQTSFLAGPVFAGDSPETVSEWYEVPIEHVRAAVEFERELATAA